MKLRRYVVMLLTFLGGLYFVLQYVVPQTVPFATTMGVMLSKQPPKITVATQVGARLDQEVVDGVTVFVRRRDPATGEFEPTAIKSRFVEVGDVVTLRTRTVTLGKFDAGAPPIDDGGHPVVLRPGEHPYPTVGTELDPVTRTFQSLLGRIDRQGRAILSAMQAGEQVNIEVPDAKITALSRGSVELLVDGRRKSIALAGGWVVMQAKRRSDPEEIELFHATVGDTIRVGPNTFFHDEMDTAAQFCGVLGTLAMVMGLLSLGMVNGRKIKRREKEWYTGVLFFGAVVLGLVAGWGHYAPLGTQMKALDSIVVVQILGSLGSAIFSLLAFYLASAAYRAFRVRTTEAAIMMITALIVMLGQTPLGMYLNGWIPEKFSFLWFSSIAGWILRTPSSAFIRALTFGVMLGAFASALRFWFSMERTAMGDD